MDRQGIAPKLTEAELFVACSGKSNDVLTLCDEFVKHMKAQGFELNTEQRFLVYEVFRWLEGRGQ